MFDYDEQDYEVDVDFDELESFDNPAQEEINSEDIEESAIEAVTSDFTVSEEIVEQLKDKMKDILIICQIYRIPCYMSFVTNDNKNGTDYTNVVYGTKCNNIHLTDDQIEKHILIANGFAAVPKREVLELDMEKIAPIEASDAEEE